MAHQHDPAQDGREGIRNDNETGTPSCRLLKTVMRRYYIKKRLSCIIMVVLLLSSSVCAKASVATESPNAPSDLFIDLYSEVFSGTDSYEIYTREGLCVTDSFVLEHYEAYVNFDFQAIWNDVLENGYVLKYGEPEYVQNPTNARATVTMTARSEWVYVLEPLDDLVKN